MFKKVSKILKNIYTDIDSYYAEYIKITFLSQSLILGIALPLLSFVLQKALNLSGLEGITESNFINVFSNPLGLATFILLIVLVVLLILLEFTLYIYTLDCHQKKTSFVLEEYLALVLRKISFFLILQALVLFVYLVLLIPIGGLNFISAITKDISIPTFIPTELFKSLKGTVLYITALIVTIYFNMRLMLVLHYYLLKDMSISNAIRASFVATKKQVSFMLAIIVVFGMLFIVSLSSLQFLSIIPILIADKYFVTIAPYIAGFSLTVATLITFLMLAIAKVSWAHLVSYIFSLKQEEVIFKVSSVNTKETISRWFMYAFFIYFAFIMVINTSFIKNIIYDNNTQIIAHRGGNTKVAVENSIEALEAAAKFNPDYVEIDVMETADGQLVLFHDETMQRLSGVSSRISDLTLDQIQSIPIQAGGATSYVPTLEEYVKRAHDLNMKILLEVKIYGSESNEFISNIIEVLKAYDMVDNTIIQSFTVTILEQVKAIDPHIKTSHIIAFNLGSIPISENEFITLEYGSINASLLAQARNRDIQIFAWTVNDRDTMIISMVSGVDGIITGELELASKVKAELESSQTLTAKVKFLIQRLTK